MSVYIYKCLYTHCNINLYMFIKFISILKIVYICIYCCRAMSQFALGVGDGQGGLMCCSPWGGKESDMTEQLHRRCTEKIPTNELCQETEKWVPRTRWEMVGKQQEEGWRRSPRIVLHLKDMLTMLTGEKLSQLDSYKAYQLCAWNRWTFVVSQLN